mmetsp:Transcript_42751/g.65702  ORF Transcript_42751/g.65702 Transcript_42751/m.65702 type:complete len:483 (+) Transcript_42751:287-1735(+)
METTVHSQFGTIDNPVLIFTSDSSWRIVICMGPGVEDDSSAHEKIYYFVREGPIHRCHVCGQCFKIVRLKDEPSEENDYYATMFAALSHYEVSEADGPINLTPLYVDRPAASTQTVPGSNVYIHVNNDEADRILIDPAYKMEKLKEAHEKVYALHEAYRLVEEQMEDLTYRVKLPVGRDIYENWVNIEKSIMKFDRIFNKVEKFDARMLTDPINHERREARMIQQRNERWNSNYTYFFGGLTEEEQQYRDYFQTDLEVDPEDDYLDDKFDDIHMAQLGHFNPNHYAFQDYAYTNMSSLPEDNADLVEQKLFKYKYRQFSDDPLTFARRQNRMVSRFYTRAETRDPALEQDLQDLFVSDGRDFSLAQLASNPDNFRQVAKEETRPFREYMVNESLQQYRDYYESDDEEAGFFEHMENFSAREKIRFMEAFEDFTTQVSGNKDYVMIRKREHNPELSAVQNMILDLVDFRDRVKPLSQDISMLE